jgi:hypothetical protein
MIKMEENVNEKIDQKTCAVMEFRKISTFAHLKKDEPKYNECICDMVHPNSVDELQFFVCCGHEEKPIEKLVT